MQASVLLKWGVEELLRKYPDLRLQPTKGDETIIAGILEFSAQARGQKLISDQYEIGFSVPADYPRAIPLVRETAMRIPRDFHKLDSDHLCLRSRIGWLIKPQLLPPGQSTHPAIQVDQYSRPSGRITGFSYK